VEILTGEMIPLLQKARNQVAKKHFVGAARQS
jgi:hypothetical protein